METKKTTATKTKTEAEALHEVADDMEKALERLARQPIDGIVPVLKTSPSLSRRTLARHIYDLARTFDDFHYATLGDGELRIVTNNGEHFRITVTKE
jgi:hypothetical protein